MSESIVFDLIKFPEQGNSYCRECINNSVEEVCSNCMKMPMENYGVEFLPAHFMVDIKVSAFYRDSAKKLTQRAKAYKLASDLLEASLQSIHGEIPLSVYRNVIKELRRKSTEFYKQDRKA